MGNVASRAGLSVLVVVVYSLLALGSGPVGSEADCTVESVDVEADVRVVDGEFDAGSLVTVLAKNTAKAGLVEVTVRLSTSEGEWQRAQTLQFDADESMKLTYFFHEPSINATGIQARAGCQP